MNYSPPLLRYFDPLPKLSQYEVPNVDPSYWITSTATNKSGELLLFSTSSKRHNLIALKVMNGVFQENKYMPRITLPFPIYGMDLWNYKALISGVCKLSILPLFSPCKELLNHSLPPSMTGRRIIEPQFHHSGIQASFLTPSLHSVTSLDLETGKLLWLSNESVASHRWDASASSTLLACLSPTASLSLLDTRLEKSQVSIWTFSSPCECLAWSPFLSHQLVVAGESLMILDTRQPNQPVMEGPSHHAQKLTCLSFHSKDMVVSGSRSGAVHVHGLTSSISSISPTLEFLGHLENRHPCTPVVGLPRVQLTHPSYFTVVYDQGRLITGKVPESITTELGLTMTLSNSVDKDTKVEPEVTAQVQAYIEQALQSPSSSHLEYLTQSLLNAYQFNAIDLPCSSILHYVCALLRKHYLRGIEFGLKLLRMRVALNGPASLLSWKPLIHLLLYPTMYDVDETLDTYTSFRPFSMGKPTPTTLFDNPTEGDVVTLFLTTVSTKDGQEHGGLSSDIEKNIQRAHACLFMDTTLLFSMIQSHLDFITLMESGADVETLLSVCRSTSTISATVNRMYLYLLRHVGYWDEYLFVAAQFCRMYPTFDCALALGRHLIFGVFPNMVKEFLSMTTLLDASTTLLFKQWLLKIGWILKYCPPFLHAFTNEFFNRTMDSLMQHACWILTTSISMDMVSIQLWIHQTLHTLNHGPFPNYLFSTLFSSTSTNGTAPKSNELGSFKFKEYLDKLNQLLKPEKSYLPPIAAYP